jgi:hypothetical protein
MERHAGYVWLMRATNLARARTLCMYTETAGAAPTFTETKRKSVRSKKLTVYLPRCERFELLGFALVLLTKRSP